MIHQTHRMLFTPEIVRQESSSRVVHSEFTDVVTRDSERFGIHRLVAIDELDQDAKNLAVVVREFGSTLAPKTFVSVRGAPFQAPAHDLVPVTLPAARLFPTMLQVLIELRER